MAKLFLSGALFFSLAACTLNNAKAQTNAQYGQDSVEYMKQCIEFIRQVKQKDLSDTNFILEDKPCYDCAEAADSAMFTREELDFIVNKKFPSISKWTNEMFPNIKIISSDTVRAIFNGKDWKDWEREWDYFYKNIGSGFNDFSAPIFLRNYTYCLFYSAHFCGDLCGESRLDLYKKENGKWIDVKNYYVALE